MRLNQGASAPVHGAGLWRLTPRSLVILGLLLFLLPTFASAQVPALRTVPEGLSPKEREQLTRRKSLLDAKWNGLRSKVAFHNQKCPRMRADTPLAAECGQAMGRLQGEIAAYVELVKNFNRMVEQASAKTRATPLLSDKDEIELGREIARRLESRMSVVTDPAVTVYMQSLLDRLAPHAGRPGFPYTVRVIRNNQVNAATYPGGYILVYTGLIRETRNESELAAVLAHEIAHASKRHPVKAIDTIARTIGVGVALTPLGPLAGLVVRKAALIEFERDQEREADRLAVEMLYRAGIRPTAMTTLFERWRRRTRPRGVLEGYFSTHPTDEERIKNIASLLADPRFKRTRWSDSANFDAVRRRLVSP